MHIDSVLGQNLRLSFYVAFRWSLATPL